MKKIILSLSLVLCFSYIAMTKTTIEDVKKAAAKYKGRAGVDEIEKLLNKGIDAILQESIVIIDGGDLYLYLPQGSTPLILASVIDNREIVKALIEAGANINAKDYEGYTALIYAAQNGQMYIAKYLIEAGADVNIMTIADEENYMPDYSALMCAAANGNIDIMEMLIEAGANINAKDYEGYTALIYAAVNEQTEAVKILIEAGIDVNAQNNDGNTALSIAYEQNNEEIIDMLIEAGAK